MVATSTAVLRLEGDLSIRNSAQLASDLLAGLTAPGPLLVDATGLNSLDVAVLQLLIAAHKSARALGKSLTVRLSGQGALDKMLTRSGADAATGISLIRDGDLWTGLTDEARNKP